MEKYFDFPQVDIKLILSDDDIKEIDFENSIFLFHATWSGQSKIHLSSILDKINKHEPKTTKIFLADIDNVTIEFVSKILGKRSTGWGEAVFYKNGQAMARHTNKNDYNEFVDYVNNNTV